MEMDRVAETGIREQVIMEICEIAKRCQVDKVRTSDIDLAVAGGDFLRFALDVEEETSTLLEFDIVDLNRCMQQELRDSIEKEGRVIYEKV